LPLCKKFIALLDHLMGSTDEVQVMLFAEHLHQIGAKGERNPSFVFAPALSVLVRVGPQQVAEKASVRARCTCIGNIGGFLNLLDLLDGLQLRRKPSMHAKDPIVDERSHWEAVEAINEQLPKLDVVSSLA
jgi:hypothetical protein